MAGIEGTDGIRGNGGAAGIDGIMILGMAGDAGNRGIGIKIGADGEGGKGADGRLNELPHPFPPSREPPPRDRPS